MDNNRRKTIKELLCEQVQKHRHGICWIRNTLAFSLVYRLLMILAVHPLTNALLNYYISNVSYQSSLTNFHMFSAFLSPGGILVLLIILFSALAFSVFELLTLTAMTWCMLHKVDYTPSALYTGVFSHLKALCRPSALLAPIYFLGLLPLTHIGFVSSYLTTLQIPNFITGELSLTLGGKLLVMAFFLLLFLLYGMLSFVVTQLLQKNASFWRACRASIHAVCTLSRKKKLQFAAVILLCFLLNLFVLEALPVPILKNSDFNIYLFRYLYHSHHFRIQLLCTILYWCFLFLLSAFYCIYILKLHEQISGGFTLSFEEDRPFFALRFFAKTKRGARILSSRLWARLSSFEHRRTMALILCPLMVIVMMRYLDQRPLLHTPWVIGHRGDIHAPENSLAGIESACAHGADYAEIDIQLTEDEQLVVFHDSSTERLGEQNLTIADHTLYELQQVPLTSRNQRYTMPSLTQAITAAKKNSDSFGLLIELKPQAGEAQDMVEALIPLIEAYNFEDRAIFMSMDYEAITYLQHLRPQWWVGYCVFGSLGKIDQNLNVDFLAIEEGGVNTRLLEQARNNAIPIYVWTINDAHAVANYLRMGVSGIIGDDTQVIREAMDDYLRYDEERYFYEETGYPHWPM